MSKYVVMGDHLDILIEECSEVIKEVCKIKRFGPNNELTPEYNPTGDRTKAPIYKLHQELADLFAIYQILIEDGTIDPNLIHECMREKDQRLKELFGYEKKETVQ